MGHQEMNYGLKNFTCYAQGLLCLYEEISRGICIGVVFACFFPLSLFLWLFWQRTSIVPLRVIVTSSQSSWFFCISMIEE